jgi:uncharacterized HAD superfamily protein
MRRRIGFDLDGTLCHGQHWNTEDEALNAVPYKDMIHTVNRLYKTDFIIIYTARQNWLMNSTFEWLDRNNVKYHAVMNKKCPVEIMVDDISKAVREL